MLVKTYLLRGIYTYETGMTVWRYNGITVQRYNGTTV
jgi:hypothetical protein